MTAYAKTWEGSTGDYGAAANWKPISVRTSAWRWIASGSGTNEYYLQTSGGAAVTWTTWKWNGGNFNDNPDRLTVTNHSRPDYPTSGSRSKV